MTEILSVHLEEESKLDRGGDDVEPFGTEGIDELLGPRSEVGSGCAYAWGLVELISE